MAMHRFRVAEESMRPGLRPGDEFVVTDSKRAGVGEVVVLLHPYREDFWLVKRRVEPPSPLDPGLAWVLSDNGSVSTADSRTFGPIPEEGLRPVVRHLDAPTFAEAVELLCSEDPALAGLVAEHGAPEFWSRPRGFATLVLFVLEQQVSLESGAAVYRRLAAAAGSVTPDRLIALGEDGMRSVGTTRQKAGYLVDLAKAVVSGALQLDTIDALPPDEARAALLGQRGIGPWTADVYLLSAIRHPDVLPVGDRALQVGAAEALGLAAAPSPDELEVLASPWRPLRSVAARILWHGYLARRGRSEPAHGGATGA